VLDGAASAGAQAAEMVQLSSLQYRGCISCFHCKLVGGKSYGRCILKDDLTPVLNAIHEADLLVLGTPIYFAAETGLFRAFVERLWFQYLIYSKSNPSMAPKKKAVALVYTMNVAENQLPDYGYERIFEQSKATMERLFAPCELFICTDTKQMKDYSKYVMEYFDPAAKDKRHEEVFPSELQRAFKLGERLVAR
jgi:multimeric flavodoxin WrbA